MEREETYLHRKLRFFSRDGAQREPLDGDRLPRVAIKRLIDHRKTASSDFRAKVL
jgi:hypothetical protein